MFYIKSLTAPEPKTKNVFCMFYNFPFRLFYQCCGSAWISNFCLDQDPELLFRIRIQQKMKEHINKNVLSHFKPLNSGLCEL